jgi:hypothetical protein
VIATQPPRRSLAAFLIPNVTFQVGPPTLKWSRGTARVTQVKLLPGQGLTLTTLGVWGSAAVSGAIAAGADADGWTLALGVGLPGELDGADDPAGLDSGLEPALAAGLCCAPLAPELGAPLAAVDGAVDAATAGVGATGG